MFVRTVVTGDSSDHNILCLLCAPLNSQMCVCLPESFPLVVFRRTAGPAHSARVEGFRLFLASFISLVCHPSVICDVVHFLEVRWRSRLWEHVQMGMCQSCFSSSKALPLQTASDVQLNAASPLL